MTNDDKRGPLTDQLAQARRDAEEREAQCTVELSRSADSETPEHLGGAPQVTRRDPQVIREVRRGIEVETNMRHEPPPPPLEHWKPKPRTGTVYRARFGRFF